MTQYIINTHTYMNDVGIKREERRERKKTKLQGRLSQWNFNYVVQQPVLSNNKIQTFLVIY